MYCINEEIYRKLDIYTKNHKKYTKCLIREIEIPINGRPEELVRQIFLIFLIKETGLFPLNISIKVESNNHDIEIYRKQINDSFKPHQNPLLIVEVKREDANLLNHYDQIQRYLTKTGCDLGILYNYHETIAFTGEDSNFKINHLKNIRDVEELIQKKSNVTDSNLLEFEKAQNGNFESFAYLVNKYARYTTNKIVFKLKQLPDEIEGYLFKIQRNKVYYDVCGKYSKKQQSFDDRDFEKLISIKY